MRTGSRTTKQASALPLQRNSTARTMSVSGSSNDIVSALYACRAAHCIGSRWHTGKLARKSRGGGGL